MKDLIVKKTKTGKGVFTDKAFKKGEVIGKSKGKLYTREQLLKKDSWALDHSLQIGENLYMGPANDVEDFVNHSCNPNSGHKIRGKSAKLVAIKDIKKGDEITFDYSTTMYNSGEEMKCYCGNKKCRKLIKDFNHLPKKIRKKYIDMGIVPKYIIKKLK